ncbi:hypothetical protein H5410_059168 [Solanum commersonii]|uniref:Uncharacterized protein n=1 Tax=Solanum commersonii TaxID=4109 RepID=A0A9J5W1S6_SOLCO|nr:hypothetical protein H5410_059168 [Solanum commersonii]
MASVGPEVQTGAFSIPNFFMNVDYDLFNGVCWSRTANGRIFKFKRSQSKKYPDFTNFRVL